MIFHHNGSVYLGKTFVCEVRQIKPRLLLKWWRLIFIKRYSTHILRDALRIGKGTGVSASLCKPRKRNFSPSLQWGIFQLNCERFWLLLIFPWSWENGSTKYSFTMNNWSKMILYVAMTPFVCSMADLFLPGLRQNMAKELKMWRKFIVFHAFM